MNKDILIFGDDRIRRVLKDDDWFYSVIDVVGVLSGSVNSRDYWYRLKSREMENGVELSTNCRQLKMRSSNGKMHMTDCISIIFVFVYSKVYNFVYCDNIDMLPGDLNGSPDEFFLEVIYG